MKYELRRKTSQHILLDVGIIIISIIGLVLTEGESIVCVFVGLMAGGFLVNELMRSKDPKLTFDENGFYIGETRYSYKQIEKITTRRDRYVTFVKSSLTVRPYTNLIHLMKMQMSLSSN